MFYSNLISISWTIQLFPSMGTRCQQFYSFTPHWTPNYLRFSVQWDMMSTSEVDYWQFQGFSKSDAYLCSTQHLTPWSTITFTLVYWTNLSLWHSRLCLLANIYDMLGNLLYTLKANLPYATQSRRGFKAFWHSFSVSPSSSLHSMFVIVIKILFYSD